MMHSFAPYFSLPTTGWFAPGQWLAFFCLLLLLLPLLAVLLPLFGPYADSWGHLRQFLLPDYIRGTVFVCLGVAVLTAIIGVMMAWIITMLEFPTRRYLEWAALLPLAIPTYVLAMVYRAEIDFLPAIWVSSPIGPYLAVVAIQSLSFYVYVYLLVRANFLAESAALFEAGRIGGSGPWGCFFRLALPMARIAVVAGVALALMESVNDFGSMNIFGLSTLTTGVYRIWNGFGEVVTAAQLSGMLVAAVMLLLLLEHWARQRKFYGHRRLRPRPPRYDLNVWQSVLAITLGWGVVVAAAIFPIATLAMWVANADAVFTSGLWRAFLHSLGLAAMVAAGLLAIGLGLAYARRWRQSLPALLVMRLSAVGYAMPGMVLALGLVLVMQQWNALSAWVGWQGMLWSSVPVLCLAYAIRFMNFGTTSVDAGLGKISRSLDEAARIGGAGGWRICTALHWPQLRPSLLAGGILIFVEIIKELPLSLMLRPFNFETLAIRAYQLAADERLDEAALPALLMVACGCLASLVFARLLQPALPNPQEDR